MTSYANPTRISTRTRILKAARWYFSATAMSLGFSEIGLRAGVPKHGSARIGRGWIDPLPARPASIADAFPVDPMLPDWMQGLISAIRRTGDST